MIPLFYVAIFPYRGKLYKALWDHPGRPAMLRVSMAQEEVNIPLKGGLGRRVADIGEDFEIVWRKGLPMTLEIVLAFRQGEDIMNHWSRTNQGRAGRFPRRGESPEWPSKLKTGDLIRPEDWDHVEPSIPSTLEGVERPFRDKLLGADPQAHAKYQGVT